MTATSYMRGWPVYYSEDAQEWLYADTDESVPETWNTRPCGHCGLYGNSSDGDIDPCLGELSGVTNACCGHGDPEMAYIMFQGGLVVRGFDIDQFHHRHMSLHEQKVIRNHNERLRKFRRMPGADSPYGHDDQ